MKQYEYKVIKDASIGPIGVYRYQDWLNEWAAKGWRLVTITNRMWIFEREKAEA